MRTGLCFALAAAALAPLPARADVSWSSGIRVTGPLATAGGGVVQSSCAVSGERQRCDLTAPAPLVDLLWKQAGEAESRIVRLDDSRVLSIRADGTVVEETFAERKARLDRLMQERPASWPLENVSVEINPTKTIQPIDDLDCEDVKLVVKGNYRTDAGKQLPVSLEADVWVSSSFPGRSQMDQFSRKETAALGLDPLLARLSALIDPRYGAIVPEFVRALATVGGTPIRIGATLFGAQSTGVESLMDARRPEGVGDRLVPMSAEDRGLVTRSDRGAPVSVRGPRQGDWMLALQVSDIAEKPADPARFEAPPGARKLVPKSRRKDSVPGEQPVAGAPPSQ